MSKIIWPLIVLILLLTLLSWKLAYHRNNTDGTHSQNLNNKSSFVKENQSEVSLSYKIIPGINNTWGYDILVDNKLTIHQPSIPSLPGNEGFKTKEGAEKVAQLVIKKMKKGEMPPSIDAEEMKRLKAI